MIWNNERKLLEKERKITVEQRKKMLREIALRMLGINL